MEKKEKMKKIGKKKLNAQVRPKVWIFFLNDKKDEKKEVCSALLELTNL